MLDLNRITPIFLTHPTNQSVYTQTHPPPNPIKNQTPPGIVNHKSPWPGIMPPKEPNRGPVARTKKNIPLFHNGKIPHGTASPEGLFP